MINFPQLHLWLGLQQNLSSLHCKWNVSVMWIYLMIIQNQLFLTICHHITDTCICILPPLNFVTCVRCIWSLKSGQQVPVPGPPSSHSSENSTMAEWSFPVLLSLPIPPFVDDVELGQLFPLLVPNQLLHLLSAPPLSHPFVGNSYLKQEILKSKYY